MNKLNGLGMELMSYKEELAKEYPDIVKKSLALSIDQLLTNELIDLDTHFALNDSDTSLISFKDYIITKKAYIKTNEELYAEFEDIRMNLDNELRDGSNIQDLLTISNVNEEIIIVNKMFLIDNKFIMDYFGVTEDKLENLLIRKGFVEKFISIRLPKIFCDFMKNSNIKNEDFQCYVSDTFYELDLNAYGISLAFNIPIEKLESNELLKLIAETIKKIILESEDFYNKKMII